MSGTRLRQGYGHQQKARTTLVHALGCSTRASTELTLGCALHIVIALAAVDDQHRWTSRHG